MSNNSDMETDEALEAAPGPVCALVDLMPAELRLQIYKIVFHGSKAHAAYVVKEDPRYRRDHTVRFRHSEHFNLLLSCRSIFHDGLPTYWSEAVLTLPELRRKYWCADSQAWRGLLHDGAEEYSYHLCSSLPAVVKENVMQIRSVLLPRNDGRFVEENPDMTATALLNNFKSLATCQITQTMEGDLGVGPHVHILCDPEDLHKGNDRIDLRSLGIFYLGQFHIDWARLGRPRQLEGQTYEPKDYLRERYGIDAGAETVFLCKTDSVDYDIYSEVEADPGNLDLAVAYCEHHDLRW